MIQKERYGFTDAELAYNENARGFMLIIPDNIQIVLGRSNKAEAAVDLAAAKQDGVPVIQRPSGGETVVLTPNTIVIAVKLDNEKGLDTHAYFRKINARIIAALSGCVEGEVAERGISDIAVGQKKILGSAMHRKHDSIFYHAVLNVAEPGDTFDRYLKHPSREPEYRKGRAHSDFVSSLKELGCTLSAEQIMDKLHTEFLKLTQAYTPKINKA